METFVRRIHEAIFPTIGLARSHPHQEWSIANARKPERSVSRCSAEKHAVSRQAVGFRVVDQRFLLIAINSARRRKPERAIRTALDIQNPSPGRPRLFSDMHEAVGNQIKPGDTAVPVAEPDDPAGGRMNGSDERIVVHLVRGQAFKMLTIITSDAAIAVGFLEPDCAVRSDMKGVLAVHGQAVCWRYTDDVRPVDAPEILILGDCPDTALVVHSERLGLGHLRILGDTWHSWHFLK